MPDHDLCFGQPAETAISSSRLPAIFGGSLLILSACGLPPFAAGSASAASFDCTKAAQPNEKMICATPDLSAKDEAMARLYKQGLAVLSSEGQVILRDGQRGWLKHVRTVCATPPRKGAKPKPAEEMKNCLADEYDSRIMALGKAAVTIGPFLMSRVDLFEAMPAEVIEDSPFQPDYAIRKVGYPRIDQPVTPETARWNKAVATMAAAGSEIAESRDLIVDGETRFAAPDFLSIAMTSYIYEHGAAHGMTGGWNTNLLLVSGKAVQAKTLFLAEKPWADFLARRGAEELTRIAAADQMEDTAFTAEQTRDIVDKPENWGITAKGLSLLFNQYSVSSFAFGMQEVLIPWRELEPYLVQPPPFPIRFD